MVEVDPTVVKAEFGSVLAVPSFGALLPTAAAPLDTSLAAHVAPFGFGDMLALQFAEVTGLLVELAER